jgi:HlyD family secretion protein
VVTAPQSGYLSELNVELGESKPIGARLGQIDIPGQFKVLASLDEYYLPLINVGMTVTVQFNPLASKTLISKIDSRVNNGQFMVEIDLPTTKNADSQSLKRGQSVALEFSLSGIRENALLLSKGAFVVGSTQHSAERRQIKLGKKNHQYFQVLSGINAGDQVITSSYNAFDKADRVIFD